MNDRSDNFNDRYERGLADAQRYVDYLREVVERKHLKESEIGPLVKEYLYSTFAYPDLRSLLYAELADLNFPHSRDRRHL